MGTSKSFGTPSGGPWRDVKREITGHLGGDTSVTPTRVVGATIAAAGGLAVPTASVSAGRSGTGRTGSGGGGGTATSAGRAAVARATSSLGGFGAVVLDAGLGAALTRLGLDELRGRPAAEVIARVAEHFAGDATGLARDVLAAALREAIFEAARLEGDTSYEALEQSLDGFLARDGVEGLVALFLTRYVVERVWLLIESHVDQHSDSNARADGLFVGVEAACETNVKALIDEFHRAGRFERVDWFGVEGQRLADSLVEDLESRLRRGG